MVARQMGEGRNRGGERSGKGEGEGEAALASERRTMLSHLKGTGVMPVKRESPAPWFVGEEETRWYGGGKGEEERWDGRKSPKTLKLVVQGGTLSKRGQGVFDGPKQQIEGD